MTDVQLHPVDTWFFRDGTPFTAESTPQENVDSLFPPHPPTVVGALRATLARANGWDGAAPWPPRIRDVLGDGPDLGGLRFRGPFLLRNEEPLFPAPRHLLGASDAEGWKPACFLRPGRPVTCDLGNDVRLPEAATAQEDGGKLEAGGGQWLTRDGMNAALRGECPNTEQVVSSACLWSAEPRIGLARARATRTAKEGMLYSTRHVRLRRGVSLGMRIAGLPADWKRPLGRLAPFGGESRLAECREWKADMALDAPLERIASARKAVLVALTPLDVEEGIHAGKLLDDLGGARLVSACLERPQRIGGWDSLARHPLPLRPVLSPGSALFCEIPDPERFADAADASGGMLRVGSRQEWGFSLVALGAWPEPQEENR